MDEGRDGNAVIMLAIDAHKRSHTVVAVNELGRRLRAKTTTATTSADHLDLIRCACVRASETERSPILTTVPIPSTAPRVTALAGPHSGSRPRDFAARVGAQGVRPVAIPGPR
jgi:hypothetical protein